MFGIDNPPGWLQDPEWAVPALVLMGLWGVGGSMIIYLAGLQGIPTDLYDAAKVDGANAWQRFWNVTFPMMTPVLFYNLVLGMIGTFQYFTEVYVATSGTGGPQRATLFYNLYLYKQFFTYQNMAYGATMASTYNARALVPEVLVRGDKFDIVRRRWDVGEQLALERLPGWLS